MPFDSPDVNLGTLLEHIDRGRIQLPDFQREWRWDDPRIASLLATVTLEYPMGVIMALETGGPDGNFAPCPLSGTTGLETTEPDQILLDGQQRLTSLYQALKSQRPVDTADPRGKKLRRWYLIDIEKALDDEADREDAILSVPEDLVVREDFGRVVKADYRTVEGQCAAGVFPLWITFDNPQIFKWHGRYVGQDSDRWETWNAFFDRVLNNIITYTVPVIVLKKSTPKEAVCTVFEKVNTGGVPLNVFELLTATFAGDKTHPEFRLKDDWAARKSRLDAKPVLRSLGNTDFLQAVTLLASWNRRAAHLEAGKDPGQAPAVTCKRKDILRLKLDEYLRWAPEVEKSMLWVAGFLGQEHVFLDRDLPYPTQLVPLAAIKTVLGQTADTYAGYAKLRQWYWCGVLGELYGGATETRFARDLEQVVAWVRGTTIAEPITVSEANFQASRLLTLRTRNSAAYKGVYALLMRGGCMDWAFRQSLDMASFLDLNVDIHHIFPKAWCDKNGVDAAHRESVVNKTALSAATNRMIGGHSPATYVPRIESKAGIHDERLDEILSTHLLDPAALRAADFDAFFAHRRAALLRLIAEAMRKPVVDTQGDSPDAYVPEPEEIEPQVEGTETEDSDTDLEALRRIFHEAMVELYRRAKDEANYNATYFLQMVSREGGYATARQLLHSTKPSDGFTALWERQRLDLSVEAHVLREEFAPLFTDEEREIARNRLTQYGYQPD